MEPLVIIPTLNEERQIYKLIRDIFNKYPDVHILVVDAQSQDGTREIIKAIQKNHHNLKLLEQEIVNKPGYGEAIKMGFNYGIENHFDPIITMDGDGSHSPEYLKTLLDTAQDYDLVSCSRYIHGVRVEGWKFRKLLVSKFANMFISYCLVKPIWDFTSGFRSYRLSFIKELDLSKLETIAYIFQIQMLDLAYKHMKRVKEIPFIYRDHIGNVSKVSKTYQVNTFFYVLRYSAPTLEILRHLVYLKRDYSRFVDEYDELINPPKLKNKGIFSIHDKYTVSVGVMAYNEEKIIEKCLTALCNQELKTSEITEIIVVSSGSTDNTNAIVENFASKDRRVRLIMQSKRRGKAAAINDFLQVARGDIAIIESADTITFPDTVEELIKPFKDCKIGMAGVRPIPVNSKNGFVGFAVNRLWELHDLMAQNHPKCGEMVAFRNIINGIPKYTAVDEAAIEGLLRKQNLQLFYARNARLSNKGPETLKDFIKQRRRIASGHRHLMAAMGYTVFTSSPSNIFQYVVASQKWTLKETFFMGLLLVVEAYSRFMGMIDFYLRDKNPFIWDISKTTKYI